MNKPVNGYTVAFALAIAFGLVGAGAAGVDITRLGRAFFALVALVLVGGVAFGIIASFLRR